MGTYNPAYDQHSRNRGCGSPLEAYSVQPLERLEWGGQGGEARMGGGSDGGETVMKF